MMFLAAVGLILFLLFLKLTLVIVPHQHAYIKERLGSFAGVLNSGWHILIPIADRIAYKHLLMEEVIDVPPQICITKDNVQVEVDGILYIRVLDPKLASYGIQDYKFASIQLAQTNMRSEVGKLDLDRTFVEREKINDAIIRSLDHASEPWGVKVVRYEIKNIIPPKTILVTMEKQMTAERDKRADIAHSEGERAARINHSEGEKLEAINLSEGEKQKRINEAAGNAAQIELVASATADGLREVAGAMQHPSGARAVQMRIVEDYIKQFGAVISQAQTSVVPVGLANIQGIMAGMSELLSKGQVVTPPPAPSMDA
jgi:regulator of protease activity HflC (stomatin/prohibitin superfamily)